MTEPPSAARPWRLARGAGIAVLVPVVVIAALWLTLPDPAALVNANPTTTALIEQRRAEARVAGRRFQPELRWIPLERISRRLVDAVVASEDAKFFTHGGFDWEALRQAFRLNLSRRRYLRGASTITQQLAKNLYLGTEKSLVRKAREALLTASLERRLDKRRILALYLNLVEWGDGTFGAEAGARRLFGASASSLTTAQAVLMAAMLPAPRRATLAPAPAWLALRARGLLGRLLDELVIPPGEHASAAAELERYLGDVPAEEPGQADEPPADEAPATEAAETTGSAPPGAAAPPPEPEPAPAEETRPAVPAGASDPAVAAPPPDPAGPPGDAPAVEAAPTRDAP